MDTQFYYTYCYKWLIICRLPCITLSVTRFDSHLPHNTALAIAGCSIGFAVLLP